jgi:hypothetical protein
MPFHPEPPTNSVILNKMTVILSEVAAATESKDLQFGISIPH